MIPWLALILLSAEPPVTTGHRLCVGRTAADTDACARECQNQESNQCLLLLAYGADALDVAQRVANGELDLATALERFPEPRRGYLAMFLDYAFGLGLTRSDADREALEAATRENAIDVNGLPQGHFKAVAERLAAAVEVRRRILGDDHPFTLEAIANRAFALLEAGQPAEAEPLARLAADRRAVVLGPDHPYVTTSLLQLLGAVRKLGRLDEAEALAQRILDARLRFYGVGSPWALDALARYADVLQDRERLVPERAGSADRLLAQAEKECVTLLGIDHPSTLHIGRFRVQNFMEQRRLPEAEALARVVVDARERALGATHRDTLKSATDLVFILDGLGGRRGLAQAAALLAEKRDAVFDPSDAESLRVQEILVEALLDEGDSEESIPVAHALSEARRQRLPPGHPDVVGAAVLLTLSYLERSMFPEAEGVLMAALEALPHTDTDALENALPRLQYHLALVYLQSGRPEKAEPMFQRLLGVAEKAAAGSSRPETTEAVARVQVGLARTLADQGRLADAEALLRVAPVAFERPTYRNGLERISVIGELVDVLILLGRAKEAQVLAAEAATLAEKLLRANHPQRFRSRLRLATALEGGGRHDDAAPLAKESLAGLNRTRGVDHVDTLRSMRLWARVLAAKRPEDSLAIIDTVCKRAKNIYGEESTTARYLCRR